MTYLKLWNPTEEVEFIVITGSDVRTDDPDELIILYKLYISFVSTYHEGDHVNFDSVVEKR